MTTSHDHGTDLAVSCCTPTTPVDTHQPLDSCCSVPAADRGDSEILSEMRDEEVAPEVAALRSAGFQLLLAHGQPVDQKTWAEAAGVEESTLSEVLESAQDRGRVELDSQGRLLGLAGLTITPTRHRLDIDGKQRWTWCALDAIGILGAVAANGAVSSTDPGTGEDIEIRFNRGVPDGDASLFILGGHGDLNVRDAWCPNVNFFTSRPAAEEWVGANGFEGEIVSVAQVAEQAADMWKPVVDQTASHVC